MTEPEDVKPRAIEVAGAGGNHVFNYLASLGLCFLRQLRPGSCPGQFYVDTLSLELI